ncbi:hypothetical protein Gotri_000862 [Gossypium trilobum]|uniref:CCHC-type domain-containing protein n=1 Tax=Gossypium trilobum TaxID=34281 RepID=A0A7J9FD31_9ROSI|nr:hypothetical protein [Gossypium trilobum]
MEEELANLNVIDKEEVHFQEETPVVEDDCKWCLVGRCLTDSVVNFLYLNIIMADLWHPIGGIFILDLGENSFLGTFLEYDTIMPTRGVQRFTRIKVRLDVSLPLKRRKKIMVGKDRVFYACIQYEKLSLFCFMCGKLGHGESFCPIRVWIDPSKIIFGWDISLRAVVNRRTAIVSQWLLKSDRSIYKILDKEGGEHGRNIQDGGGMWSNWRDNMGKLYPNPNHIPLGPIIMSPTRDHKKHIVDCGLETRGVNVIGPMRLTSNGDEGPLMTMEGKKRQHLVREPSLIFNEDK